MSQQQTVLRVQFDNVNSIDGIPEYEFLDLYGDVPIKINKSFAELQDISKRNSDYSIGLQLPGSKKNNKFFESFFNVDSQSLYFDANKRVPCNVLLDDVSYFSGYMRLNKTSVLDSKVEYSVTLYSTIGDLFGNIGNGLLNELDFDDLEYKFNHVFNLFNVSLNFGSSIFSIDDSKPKPYFYPIVHNGYSYTANTSNQLVVQLSGSTVTDPITRLYTSTTPITNYTSLSGATAAGVRNYRINSPGQGLVDNQLKPALNVYSLIQLMFKKYGYTIKSDFFNTPWFKASYLYGYFSSDATLFSYEIPPIQTFPLQGVSIVFLSAGNNDYCFVTKLGTTIPVFCSSNIDVVFQYDDYPYGIVDYPLTIIAGTTGVTSSYGGTFYGGYSSQVPNGAGLQYLPQPAGTLIPFVDNSPVQFSKVISKDIKQIDLLSSIAKKFNLVFVPDPEVQNQIIIEPYSYYIGTGDIHDWSDKISYDKGFSVEPALNYIESELFLSDLEDGDYGNLTFKNSNNRIYGQNIVYNPTDFKSQQKKIDTIFSPEIIRTWDDNIDLPLGINYVGTTETVKVGGNESLAYVYKGVRTKPKLMFWLGGFNPFLNTLGEVYSYSGVTNYPTYNVYVSDSSLSGFVNAQSIPIISHTMPIGNPDSNKGPLRGFNNDSICNLFNSEESIKIGTTETYNVYTENDIYNLFYSNRIDNLYNPNTRFLKGQFNLKYNDIQNLKPNDLIKINEQYFTWNKIDGFNLTNRELTQVELIQTNNNPSQYPIRYFSYYYCDNPGTCFKFKTDFTNPNLRDTNYYWSLKYDYNIGLLGGSATGFTSSFYDLQNNVGKYIPYYMTEITEDNYNTSTCQYFTCDTLLSYLYDLYNGLDTFISFSPIFWISSGITNTPPSSNTVQGLNVFSGCTQFNTAATTYGITTGSSIYHGAAQCPTPTPTSTITPTPTPTLAPIQQYILTNKYSIDAPFISSDYGVTFNSSIMSSGGGTTGRAYNDNAMSSDGQYQYLAVWGGASPGLNLFRPYKSSDYGVNFATLGSAWSARWWLYISCSKDGKYILAGSNSASTSGGSTRPIIQKSSDYGVTVSTETLGGLIPGNVDGSAMAMCGLSSTGQYQTIFVGFMDNIYAVSSDYGNTFTNYSGVAYISYDINNSVSISDNGQYQLANYNGLSISTNYGVTWTQKYSTLTQGACMSSDGQYQYSTIPNGILKSSNYGSSFSVITGFTSNDVKDIDCSSNGQTVYVTVQNSSTDVFQILKSTDYGQNWTTLSSDKGGNHIKVSKSTAVTPTPTPTATVGSSPTPTATPAITPTSTPTGTPAVTPTSTPTGTPAASPTSTPTGTPVVTTTPTPTGTPAPTPVQFSMTINTTAEGSNYVVGLPYYSGGTYSGTINWGDGSTSGNTYANNSHTYVTGGTYTITISGTINGFNTAYNTVDGVSINRVLTSINQFGSGFSFGTNDPGKFERCKLLTSVASDIPLSGVNFKQMFNLCTVFNQDISGWNVSIGSNNMREMFQLTSFNQNINSWNVSGVTDMKSMFQQSPFNQPLSGWNVSNVTIMASMFNSSTFNQNIGMWNVSNVTDMSGMLTNATSFTTTNLNNIYNGWSALPSLQSNVPFGASVCYTATAGRGILTGTYNWTITDGGVC